MTDIAMIQQASGGAALCTPDMAALRLHDLQLERALDALVRPRCTCPPTTRCSGGDFIDFTQEENPDVND